MPRPVSVQPPIIVALVGRRNAAMYARCSCGGIRAKQARCCLVCYQEVRTDRRRRA